MYDQIVRTTIEIKPEHRAQLMELAAKRGEKGFSNLVSEALDSYLEAQRQREQAVRAALAEIGSFTDDEVADLRTRTREIREAWR
jgi:predicted transcriptional regulator